MSNIKDFSIDEMSVHSSAIEEPMANAHLIAAAPDLLAACEMALKVGISYPLDTPSRIDSHTEQILRAAIAKAKGEMA